MIFRFASPPSFTSERSNRHTQPYPCTNPLHKVPLTISRPINTIIQSKPHHLPPPQTIIQLQTPLQAMMRVLKMNTGDLDVLIEACSNLAKHAGIEENQALFISAGGIHVHTLAHHRITSLVHHRITTNVHNPGIMLLASTLPNNSTNPL